MAAPNLIGANTILGKTTGANLTSTSMTTVLNNGASSNKTLKVNVLNFTNYSSGAVLATVSYFTTANVGGTEFRVVDTATVPAYSTLNVIDKTSQYYLEEDKSLGAKSNTANAVHVTVSYEDIS